MAGTILTKLVIKIQVIVMSKFYLCWFDFLRKKRMNVSWWIPIYLEFSWFKIPVYYCATSIIHHEKTTTTYFDMFFYRAQSFSSTLVCIYSIISFVWHGCFFLQPFLVELNGPVISLIYAGFSSLDFISRWYVCLCCYFL